MARTSARKSSRRSQKKKAGSRELAGPEQLIWGIHPVYEALKACSSAIREVFVAPAKSGARLEKILELARRNAIAVKSMSDIPGQGHVRLQMEGEQESSQGVAARIIVPTITIEELVEKAGDISGPPLFLALDSIQDPHNLGAIIRSAAAAGVNGIILPRDRSAPITGTVVKTSAGAVFHVNVCLVTNLVSSFKVLKEKGIWIFGAAKDASMTIYDADLTVPVCIVIGSEGKGLRPLVAEHCDLGIGIPMQSNLDSLNASVAAGIILFESVRQRRLVVR